MNPMSPIEESKPAMCLSPQEKLKSAVQRNKRSHATGVLTGAGETKKARVDDVFQTELKLEMDGWVSDDYLRTMDFDDCLNQDIDWVAHDAVDLALSMDSLAQDQTVSVSGDDVNDFASFMSPLRGGLAFEDPAEMASTFVDPAYIRMESASKDAEKLLMSFDTMNFKIPSPTSASSKKRGNVFAEKNSAAKRSASATTDTSSTDVSVKVEVSAIPSATTETRKENSRASSPLPSASASTDPLSVLNSGMTTPKANHSSEKKIGSYTPEARKLRLQRFHEKRKNRTWKKSIKYDCRKKLADDRPRIKGRFVRVVENAGDAKTGAASRSAPASASPPSASSAGYTSPTSPTGALAPPAMALPGAPRKSTSVSSIPRVVPSCATGKQTASVAPSASSAALPFARMIASV